LDESAEEFAVCVTDNYSSSAIANVIDLLRKALVLAITFGSHATQIFQILDVTLFSILKWHRRYEFPLEDEKATCKFIMKVCHGIKQTMVEPNIWEALQAFGFGFDTTSQPHRLLFNEGRLQGSSGFPRFCSVDFSRDKLASR
jgi:hypothetical protein